jgi:hypothetical protein
LRGAQAEIEARGARLAFVGSGSPGQAADFGASHAPGVDIYTDPSTATYPAIGTARGVGATLGPRAAIAGLRAVRGGFRQGMVKGDVWMQGAVLVVLPGDRVVYTHVNRHNGDHPSTGEVLAALRRATEPAG